MICEISLNNDLPKSPSILARANHLSVEHITPPVMAGKNSVVIRSSIYLMTLLMFDRYDLHVVSKLVFIATGELSKYCLRFAFCYMS